MLIKHLLERSITRNSFTHDGNEYDLKKLNRLIKDNDIKKFRISKLKWIFKHDDPFKDEPERIKTANIKVPIIITKWRKKLVVLDGLHRLCKADIMGLKALPGRLATPDQLEKCLISKLNEASNKKISMKDQIVQDMISSMFNDVVRKSSNIGAVRMCINRLHGIGVTELDELLQPYQASILDWLKHISNQSAEYVGEIAEPAGYLYQATKWPAIVELLNELKPKLIKSVLLRVQQNLLGLALAWLIHLQEIPGCNWPELKTIQTSVEHELTREIAR